MRSASLAVVTIAMLLGQEHGRSDAAAEVAVRGSFVSGEYGYSVSLPDGIMGFRPPPPAPQHGFGATLPNESDGYLWVNAEYDVLMLGNSVRAAQDVSERLSKLYGISMAGRAKRNLSGLDAQDVTLVNRTGGGRINYVHLVVAYRAVPGEVGIVYTLGLRENTRSGRSSAQFAALTESFTTREISE